MIEKSQMVDVEDEALEIMRLIDGLSLKADGLCYACGEEKGHTKWCAVPSMKKTKRKLHRMIVTNRLQYAERVITANAHTIQEHLGRMREPVEAPTGAVARIIEAVGILQGMDHEIGR